MQLGRGRDKISNRSAYAVSFDLTPDIGPHWSSDAFSVYGSPLRSPDPLPYEWSNEQTDETPDRLAEWLPNRWSFPLSITHAQRCHGRWLASPLQLCSESREATTTGIKASGSHLTGGYWCS